MAKILFVAHESELGGPAHSLLELLRFIRLRHEILVLAPGNGKLFKVLQELEIPAITTNSNGLQRKNLTFLRKVILENHIDLVYGNNFSSGPRNALIAAKLSSKPFIWHIREILSQNTTFRKHFFLRFADRIIAVSHASEQSIKPFASNKRIYVIPNGVEIEKFSVPKAEARKQLRDFLNVPSETKIVINVGMVSTRKGQAFAVQAALQVLPKNPDTIFVFLGKTDIEPNYTNQILEQIEKSSQRDKVKFLGFRSDTPYIFAGSDIYLHTAAWDPNPRVILEAMASCLPVIAFSVDGVKEQVLDGVTGSLIMPGNTKGLVEAIQNCLNNPSLRETYAQMGHNRAKELFTSQRTFQDIYRIITDLL